MSVTTNATDLVEAVYEILEGTPATSWTLDAPKIYYLWDVPVGDRGPGADMPAQMYVYENVDTSINKFSADGNSVDSTQTVMVQMWVLKNDDTPHDIITYRDDVIDLFTEYYSDNQNTTTFTEVRPTASGDFREQVTPSMTDYYIVEVEILGRALRDQSAL